MIAEQLQNAWKQFDSGNAVGAEALYCQCLVHADTLDRATLSSVYMGLIYAESFLGKFQEARHYAALLLQGARNNEDLHIALHQSGMVERMAGNYEAAMALFQREYTLIRDAFSGEDVLLAANLYEQGILYMNSDDFARAQELMKQSLTHALASQDPMCIGCSHRGLGEILYKGGQFSQADTFFVKAISAFQSAGDPLAVQEVEALRSMITGEL